MWRRLVRENFNGCSKNGEEHCDTREGFSGCGGNRHRENFNGCSRNGEEHCDIVKDSLIP